MVRVPCSREFGLRLRNAWHVGIASCLSRLCAAFTPALSMLAATCLTPASVCAEPAARPAVVIVMEGDLAALAGRVGDELDTMGFRAVVTLRENTAPEELPALTRQAEAVAGARFNFVAHSIRLWLFDRTTGKTLMRELQRPETVDQTALALHTVELLRASLLELELPDAPRGELEASPSLFEAARLPPAHRTTQRPTDAPGGSDRSGSATPAALPPVADERMPALDEAARDPFLSVEVGAALVGAQGDFGHVPNLMLGLGWFVSHQWRLGALAFLPLVSTRHESLEGSSETRVTPLGVEARWQLPRGALRPFACLGLSMANLRTRGRTERRAYEGRADSVFTFGGYACVGLGLGLTDSLRISPRATLGAQQRYFAVDYAGREAARWGAWWWAGSLAFEGDFE